MDKRVIFAVAGAGKTTHIINSLSKKKRALIITYTENNFNHLRDKVIQKFGYIPENITIQKYFTFLYSFCYNPFFRYVIKASGINWDHPPISTLKIKRNSIKFYLDDYSRLYHNRIAKLVTFNNGVKDIINRLEKYFDELYVDEVQDFGGHDFNLLKEICMASIKINLVGDFYQHTFDTSRDGNTNKNLYIDFSKYKKHFEKIGISIDTETLSKSYRCPPSVCNFIKDKLRIEIESNIFTEHSVEYISDTKTIENIFYNDKIVKLFYQENQKYPCFSNNWGASKGLDSYHDVCISLYPQALKSFCKNDFSTLVASSRNKLYVACTRTNGNLFFVSESELKKFQIK